MNSIILLINLSKSSKIAQIEKDYWKWNENSSEFWRKSARLWRQMKDHQDLTNDFHRARKSQKDLYKHFAFGPKLKNVLKFFQQILRLFVQNLYENLTFFTIFPTYFLELCLLSDTSGRKPQFSITNFPISWLGTFRRSALPMLLLVD